MLQLFSTFSVHYPSITEYKFGRPATDAYHLYETPVTRREGGQNHLQRSVGSINRIQGPFCILVNLSEEASLYYTIQIKIDGMEAMNLCKLNGMDNNGEFHGL